MTTPTRHQATLVACVILLAIPATAEPIVCPVVASTDNSTTLNHIDSVKRYNELSGLAISPTQTGPSGQPILYGANDGGGGERMGVWDTGTGERIMSLRIPNNRLKNTDWEDMTIGSCGSTGVDDVCIYIADVGDNVAISSSGRRSRRSEAVPYQILKIREPNLEDYRDNDVLPDSSVSILPFNYLHPSSPTAAADCESMFIDPTGWGEGGAIGDLYLITKWYWDDKGNCRLFKIPASVWPDDGGNGTMYSPEAVGTYVAGGALDASWYWTRAESSRDGTIIQVGEDVENFLFLRCPGATVAEVLANPDTSVQNCLRWFDPTPGQSETFAWMPDGMSNLQIPEWSHNMGWTTMSYDVTKTTQTCPEVGYVQGQCVALETNDPLPDAWCQAANPDTSTPTLAPVDQSTVAPTSRPSPGPTLSSVHSTLSPSVSPPTLSPVHSTLSPSVSPTLSPVHSTLSPSFSPPTLSPVDWTLSPSISPPPLSAGDLTVTPSVSPSTIVFSNTSPLNGDDSSDADSILRNVNLPIAVIAWTLFYLCL